MARISYLDKAEFERYASAIFDILADNMTVIAPTGCTREEDYACWHSAVGEGILAPARQIILIFAPDSPELIGFFQYYTNSERFMMEEIQFKPEWKGRGNIFRELYGFVLAHIDTGVEFVEAYANKNNHKSIGILKHLGLSVLGENKSGSSYHFRGYMRDLLAWYRGERCAQPENKD